MSSASGNDGGQTVKDHARKRVARACDRCRLKKGKCDGRDQCAKCVSADVMCIYTDRKPPVHKTISSAAAEALQSENLTLKKSIITIYKALVHARNDQLPFIEGVDWDSDKVANGKSGRALNHIISQEARVDNRISGEEFASYDSDTQTNDHYAHEGCQPPCPDSPNSQYSYSPRSSTADMAWMFETPQAEEFEDRRLKKRKSARYSYSPAAETTAMVATPESTMQEAVLVQRQPGAPFIDPNLLQPSGSIGSTFSHPPTPPTPLDTSDFLRASSRLGTEQMQWANNEQHMLYDNSMLLQQQYGNIQQGRVMVTNTAASSIAATAPPPQDVQWANAQYYQYLGEKEELRRFVRYHAPRKLRDTMLTAPPFARVFESMDASMQDSMLV